jgi:O-antigen/teichoic acid export membrane protein
VKGTEFKGVMASALRWAMLASVTNQLLGFIVFIAMVRLVSTVEFGVFALAMVLIDLLQLVAGGGISEAVIQRQDLTEKAADTAFWSSLAGGAIFALIGAALASPLERFFGVPGLEHALLLLSLVLTITPLGSIHAARLTRAFGFRPLVFRLLTGTLVSGAIGIGVALAGGGVDAMIAQRVSASLAFAGMAWLAYRWRPRLRFDRSEGQALAVYGLRSMASQFVLQANWRAVDLIAGFAAGPIAVATLRVASRCIDVLIQVTVSPFQQAAFPLFSRVQEDPAVRRTTYGDLSRLSAAVVYPTFAGTFVVAPDFIPLIFGEQWREAGHIVQLICLGVVALHFNVLMSVVLSASGHPGHVLAWSLVQFLLGIAGCALGAHYGIAGLVVANVARAYLLLPLGWVLLWRKVEIGVDVVICSVLRPLLAAVMMAGLTAVVEAMLLSILPP